MAWNPLRPPISTNYLFQHGGMAPLVAFKSARCNIDLATGSKAVATS